MKCPYCNKEMKSGYIKSTHMIRWGEAKELGYLPHDIRLSKWGLKEMINGVFVQSCYCDECRKIIISLDEDEAFS